MVQGIKDAQTGVRKENTDPRHPWIKPWDVWMIVIPGMSQQRQADPWELSQIDELQV